MKDNTVLYKRKRRHSFGDCIGLGILLLFALLFREAANDAGTPHFSFLYIVVLAIVLIFIGYYILAVADSYWGLLVRGLVQNANNLGKDRSHNSSENLLENLKKDALIRSVIWLLVLGAAEFILSKLFPVISNYILFYVCLSIIGIICTWVKASRITVDDLASELNVMKATAGNINATRDANQSTEVSPKANDSLIVETRILGRDPIYEDQQMKEHTDILMPNHIIPYPATTYKTRQVQTGVAYTFLVFYQDGHKENEKVREGSQRYQFLIQFIKQATD